MMDGRRWVAVALLGTCCWAQAGDHGKGRGLYGASYVGAGYTRNTGAGATEVDFDLGRPIGMQVLGFDTGRGWRFEIDGSHRFNDAEVVFFDDGTADVQPNVDSGFSALGIGLTAVRVLDVGAGFAPFVGAGVAAARVDLELTEFITERTLLDDSDRVTAYQLLAGFDLPLAPRWDFTAEYRFWQAPDVALTDVDGVPFDTDYRVQSILAGVRYRADARASSGVLAAGGPGWYARLAAGPSFARDAEIEGNLANFDAFDVGSTTTAAVGRRLNRRWRVEVEAARRRNEAELVDFNPEFGEDRASGRVRAASAMVNAIYEPGWRLPFRPYGALGLGMAWSDWSVRLEDGETTYVDDADRAWALQAILGASAPLARRLSVAAEYRYWMTGLFELREPDGRPMPTELAVHGVQLGLQYSFR